MSLFVGKDICMKFINLIKYDIYQGTILSRNNYKIILITWGILLCSKLSPRFSSEIGSFLDYVILCFGGTVPLESSIGSVEYFKFPIQWLLMLGSCSFYSLSYPFRDINSIGTQMLTRANRRVTWWLAKCFWCVANTIHFFALELFSTVFFCYVTGTSISLNFSVSLLKECGATFPSPQLRLLGGRDLLFTSVMSALQLMIAINLLQMLVGFVSQQVWGLVTSLSILVISSIWFSPFAIGNYGMLIRSNLVSKDGLSFLPRVFIIFPILSVAIMMVGGIVWRKLDLLPKEEIKWS